MADTGKKGKKKKVKGKTLNLTEFLSGGDGKQGNSFTNKKAIDREQDDRNIAYDSDDEAKKEVIDLSNLPTAPRSSREAVDPKSLPTEPPYTAFLGNLPYDVEEEDIEEFFAELKLDKVRLPRDGGRMRGFGYAEFVDVESLVQAIELNNESLKGRKIRVDIAGNAGGGDGTGRDDSREERSTDWRRDGVGESRPYERAGRDDRVDGGRRGGDRGDRGDIERSSEADDASTWRRGEPLDSSRPEPRKYESRGDRSWGGGGGDSAADSESSWRRGSPTPNRSEDRRGFGARDGEARGGSDRDGGDRRRYGGRDSDGRAGYDDRRRYGGNEGEDGGRMDHESDSASTWRSDASTFKAREPEIDRRSDARPAPSDNNPWRRPREDVGERPRPSDSRAEEPQREAPVERPRLNLKPRTVDESKKDVTPTSSIFGGARPVDTATKEKEIEEKLKHEPIKPKPKPTKEGQSEQNGTAESAESPQHKKQTSDNRRQSPGDKSKARNMSPGARDGGRERIQWGDDSQEEDQDEERAKSEERKKQEKPVAPRHYEEPKVPVFSQKSAFAILANEDEDANSSHDEED